MKYRFLFASIGLSAAMSVSAATSRGWTNEGTILGMPPQIDASWAVNKGTISTVDLSLDPLPFQTLNTLGLLNEGRWTNSPGFRWDFFTNNVRRSMAYWTNSGTMSAPSQNQVFLLASLFTPVQWLLVSASNIHNSGILDAGAQSLIRLEGRNLNLARSRIRTGAPLDGPQFFTGGYLLSSNYFNDLGIIDLYWGEGTNNALNNQGSPIRLDGATTGGTFSDPFFSLPFARSPQHMVIENFSGLLFTNFAFVPSIFSFNKGFQAFAYTNFHAPSTSTVIQVVFVATNGLDTNLTADVRFYPEFTDGGATAIVGFNSIDRDAVLDRFYTNSVYLLDALAFETNVFLSRNFLGSTRRPNTYEVTKGVPFQFQSFFSVPANIPYTDTLLYNPTYLSNSVPVIYTAYGAQVSSLNFSANGLGNPTLSDPTNFPGRVEIRGEGDVNLQDARIRADSTLILRAANVTSTNLPRVNAPFVNFDVGTARQFLLISNVAPRTVNRLNGTLSAWSATWNNTEVTATGATNRIRFHVLMVDHTFSTLQPVVINRFAARGANHLVVGDQLNVNQTLKLDGQSLWVQSGINFPTNSNWSSTNVLNVLHFTNDGVINVSGAAFAGTDRPVPYVNYINRGTNNAVAHFIRADHVQNSGSLSAAGGVLSITAGQLNISGVPLGIATNYTTNLVLNFQTLEVTTNFTTNVVVTGARLQANADIEIAADSLTFSNAYVEAGAQSRGGIELSVASRLSDAGPGVTNLWLSTDGIRLTTRPAWGDLLGTYMISRAESFAEVRHVWPAVNFGASPRGYENNLAIGKLTLDGAENSSFRFEGAAASCAIYVDYLELLNNATNYNTALDIDPSITIYFALANLPASKLNDRPDGRLRWVRGFAGPLSSTNVIYPSGATNGPFNIALIQDKDIDSDGDGEVNSKDPTPVYVGETVNLTVGVTNAPGPQALLSWQGLANSTCRLEFLPSAAATVPWQVLRVTNLTGNGRVFMTDPLINGRMQRVYRVRVDTPPL